MSHNLNYNKKRGTYSFYSKKEIAWHGLGQVVEEAKTSDEVLKIANLDFHVVKAPNFAKVNENEYVLNPLSFSTVREDTNQVLGTVGTRYEILQNVDAFKFFDDIVGRKEAIYETAGALGNGEKIFISAKMPNIIRYKNNDIIEDYLLIVNDHTGKAPIKVLFTPTRVVCNNTMRMALKGAKNIYVINHNSLIKDRLKEVQNLMGIKNLYLEEMNKVMQHLESIKIDEGKAKTIIINSILTEQEKELLVKNNGKLATVEEISTRKKNIIYDMYRWTDEGDGQNLYRGTGLWLYNGINGYYSNGKNYTTNEKRLESITDGDAYTMTNNILNLIQIDE